MVQKLTHGNHSGNQEYRNYSLEKSYRDCRKMASNALTSHAAKILFFFYFPKRMKKNQLITVLKGSYWFLLTGSPPHAPSNKFFEVLYQIERATYAAQAAGMLYTQSSKRLAKIEKNIKLASKQGNQMFARQSLGDGLYSAIQLDPKKTERSDLSKSLVLQSRILWIL